jgi:hypothetical protein
LQLTNGGNDVSHISENKTAISKVHESLLQEALELIAKVEPGFTVSTHIKDYGMNDVAVNCAVYTPKLKRGLGLNWKNNSGLEFKGDDWDAGKEYERLQKLIILSYQTLAVQKSLEMMGYSVNAQQQNANTVRLEAVHA